jgi:hypothetical protein
MKKLLVAYLHKLGSLASLRKVELVLASVHSSAWLR